MPLHPAIKTSNLLRAPLLALTRLCLSPLASRIPLLQRAAYDVYPNPYLVVGDPEKYVVSTKDKGTGRLLFQHGEIEFQKLVTAINLLAREGFATPHHLIDVGANIGIIVIPAIARGLVKSATAIEPHPENVRLLYTNLALNGVLDRTRVLAQAVGAESGVMLLLDESPVDSSIHAIGDTGIATPSSKLDDLELPCKGALLWMDIEGYEGHALHGASNLLALGVPVVCEFNPRLLSKAGGMEWFRHALQGRRIYDLKQGAGARETSLDALAAQYAEHPLWTDLLAVPSRLGS
ncbi:FkbM family methyltransferase [Pseudoxanthomonas sp. LjRoot143]|uniref:FkbM family methyltransferase n=1 Tax=Pseudoxanthomonas sp. LjRoot143 TaxID=3342266 RepID=UPI003ED0AC9B